MDITEVKRLLAGKAQTVAEHLLPNGRKEGHEWRVGSVDGEPGKSLGVHIGGQKSGVWSDFTTGEGGDLLDLWCAVRRVQLSQALAQAREWLGIVRPNFHQPDKREWKRPEKPKCRVPEGRVWAYLTEERNLPIEAINAYKIAEDDGENIIFPFLLPDGTLAMAKRREAIDGAKPKPTEADCEHVLFGWQAIPPNARTVVITEGEIDAVSMYVYGFPALSVPYGGGTGNKHKWIESEYERLERFEKIYLALDMDGPGEEAVRDIANRLGTHRCVRVKLPHKDANECLMAGVRAPEIKQAIDNATWFENEALKSPVAFTDDVIALFWPKEGEHVGYRTPYGKLGDKLLFRPGELTIWTGDSGAGKTQILNDCIVDWVQQGARSCVASLEMAPKQTLKRMAKQVVGTDRPTPEAIAASNEWMQQGLLLYTLTGKQKLEELLKVFDYGRARYGCDTFVVDSLMRLGVAGDDYNSQEAAIFRLVDWTMAANVHLHLVAHAKKGERERGVPAIEDIKGAMEIGANAFNIVAVWRNRKHEEGVNELTLAGKHDAAKELYESKPGVVLNVAKQRNGDFEGKIGLWFDQKTYRYRSGIDAASWKRQYLPENWRAEKLEELQKLGQEIEAA